MTTVEKKDEDDPEPESQRGVARLDAGEARAVIVAAAALAIFLY